MNKKNIIIFCLILTPTLSLAETPEATQTYQQQDLYPVYNHNSDAYILLQPTPGVFLGQMLRNIGLSPDWKYKQWIKLIHYANPNTVDHAGEILNHDQKLKFPVEALVNLKGYPELEKKLVIYEDIPTPPIVQEETPQETIEQAHPLVTEEVEVVEPQPDTFKSTYALDILAGAGTDQLYGNDKVGNDTTLTSEANIAGMIRFHGQVLPNHQLGFSVQYNYKTYTPPPSIFYVEDRTNLVTLKYNWGYKLFNNFYLRLVGQSESKNFIQFPNNNIRVLNFWAHSAGLQMDAPLFNMGSYAFLFKLNGKLVYANTADFDIGTGYLASLSFEIAPSQLNSGFVFGVSGDYFSQPPSHFDDYNTIEFLGYLGYRF